MLEYVVNFGAGLFFPRTPISFNGLLVVKKPF